MIRKENICFFNLHLFFLNKNRGKNLTTKSKYVKIVKEKDLAGKI